MSITIVLIKFFFFFSTASLTKNYKVLQRASAREHFPYSWKVFASWDHCITDPDTAATKKNNITVALRVCVCVCVGVCIGRGIFRELLNIININHRKPYWKLKGKLRYKRQSKKE